MSKKKNPSIAYMSRKRNPAVSERRHSGKSGNPETLGSEITNSEYADTQSQTKAAEKPSRMDLDSFRDKGPGNDAREAWAAAFNKAKGQLRQLGITDRGVEEALDGLGQIFMTSFENWQTEIGRAANYGHCVEQLEAAKKQIETLNGEKQQLSADIDAAKKTIQAGETLIGQRNAQIVSLNQTIAAKDQEISKLKQAAPAPQKLNETQLNVLFGQLLGGQIKLDQI